MYEHSGAMLAWAVEAFFDPDKNPLLNTAEEEILEAWFGDSLKDCDCYVKSSTKEDSTEIRLNSLDMFFGGIGVIDSVWFFEREVNSEAFQESLTKFLSLYPELSGRIHREHDRYVLYANNQGVAFTEKRARGSALNYSGTEPKHGLFSDIRATEDIMTGKAPVMTVQVTKFADGSSAVGFAMAHCIVDSYTFYNLIQEFSLGHNKGFASKPKYSFKRNLISLPELYNEDGPQEVFLTPLQRSRDDDFFRKAAQQVGRKRSRVHFKGDELSRIKGDTPSDETHRPSGNDMLLARLCAVLGQMVLGLKGVKGSSDTKESRYPPCQLAPYVNIRGALVPETYAGNAFWSPREMATLELADLCTCWARIGAPFRSNDATNEACMSIMRKWAKLECGEMKTSTAFWGASNQSSGLSFLTNSLHRFPLRSVSFGAGTLIAVQPQNLGDPILIAPAKDGMYVYINSHAFFPQDEIKMNKLQRSVESADFKKQVLDVTSADYQDSLVMAPGNGKTLGLRMLNSIDGFYGLHAIVDSVWFFEGPLDPKALRASLTELLSFYPELSGRVTKKGESFAVDMCNKGVLMKDKKLPGSAKAYVNSEPPRGLFAVLRDEKAIMNGDSPLMTVLVTNFEDGTSALGVAISHGLVDAISFHNLIGEWAHCHVNGFRAARRYDFDRGLVPMPKREKPAKGYQNLMQRCRDEMHFSNARAEMGRKRACLRFSAEELKVIKEMTPCAGELQPSSSTALFARICFILALKTRGIFGTPSAKIGLETQVVGHVNLRERATSLADLGIPKNYAGNGFVTLWKPCFVDLRCMCRAFYDIANDFRKTATVDALLFQLAGVDVGAGAISEIFNAGRAESQTMPKFSSNCLRHVPIDSLSFNSGKVIGFAPHTSGEAALLVVPDIQGDGVCVYINPHPWTGKDEAEWEKALNFIISPSFKEEVMQLHGQHLLEHPSLLKIDSCQVEMQDIIKSSVTEFRSHKLLATDIFFGLLGPINTTWMFTEPLDGAAMRASLEKFVGLYPELTGRIRKGEDGKSYCLETTNEGLPFTVRRVSGSAHDYKDGCPPWGRFEDLREPSLMMTGMEPLMSVLVTLFEDGTSALGVSICHGLGDGASLYMLMNAWAEGHANGFPEEPKFSFDKDLVHSVLPELDEAQKPPLDEKHSQQFRDGVYTGARAEYGVLRAPQTFTKAELDHIKKNTPCHGKTPTSMEALLARVMFVISRKNMDDVNSFYPGCPVNLLAFSNIRNRGISEKYIGNSLYMASAFASLNVEQLCGSVNNMFADMRSSESAAKTLEIIAKMEAGWESAPYHFYSTFINPDCGFQQFLINSQRSFGQLDVSFGAGECINLIPQNCGDSILSVPAKDGGITLWLAPHAWIKTNEARFNEFVKYLCSQEFRDAVLDDQLSGKADLLSSEMIQSSTVDSPAVDLDVGDAFAAHGSPLDAVWFYEKAPNVDALRESLTSFLKLYPQLCGRISISHEPEHFKVQGNEGVAFSSMRCSGSAHDYQAKEPERGKFTDMRDAGLMLSGRAPVMTVRVTIFEDGTGAVGVLVSSALVDALSFYELVIAWARGHSKGFPASPEYSFNRDLTRQCVSLDPKQRPAVQSKFRYRLHHCDGQKRPLLNLFSGEFGRKRVRINFSKSELATMRDNTTCLDVSPSDEEAVLMRLVEILVPRCMASSIGAPMQIMPLINMFDSRAPKYLGHTQLTEVKKIKSKGQDVGEFLRNSEIMSGIRKSALDRLAKVQYGNSTCSEYLLGEAEQIPTLTWCSLLEKPICSVDFGCGKLIAVAPHKTGEHNLLMPAVDGGLTLYTNPRAWLLALPESIWEMSFTIISHMKSEMLALKL